MKIKNVVLISLIISLSLMLLILVLGSMLPTSTLDSMSAWFNKTQAGSNTSLNTTSNSSSQAPGGITTTPTSTATTTTPTAVVTTTTQSTATPKPTATKAPTATTTTTTTTVTTTAPPTYCGGNTPCYGQSDLAAHATTGNCWSYQTAGGVSVIYNMSNFSNVHSGGQVSQLFAGCGGAINWSGVPNNSKHTAAKANSESIFNQYRVGFYDSTKP